jgi:hypothetical protein
MLRRRILPAGLCCVALVGLLPAAVDPAESKVEKKYRLEFPVAKAAPPKDTTETRTFFADALLDKDGGRLFYAAQATPTLGVLKGDEKAVGKGDKPAKELYRLVLQARTWDEKEIDKDTRKFTVEVFRDENTGHLVYVSEAGAVAVVAAPKDVPTKAPETRWLYRLKLRVRPPGEADFTFETLKCNVEVYREADSGRLIYLPHNGNLAVSAPGKEFKAKEAKEPKWTHAFVLKARTPEDREFNPRTPQFSLEVYDDENSETALYVTNTFALAVLPGVKELDMGKIKEAEWQRGLVGDKWSGEVYLNPNLDQLMFITSAGGFAVLPR